MRLINCLQKMLEVMLALLLAFMVITVFGNVVLRYLFHSGLPYIEELSRFAFVWVTFIGGVVLLRGNGHLGFDSLVHRLPPKAKMASRLVCNAAIIFLSGMLVSGGWMQVLANLGERSQSAGFPMGIFYSVGPFAGGLMILVMLEDACRLLRNGGMPPDRAHSEATGG